MAYFNYHAKAKNLIKAGHCFSASLMEEYHHIRPALVLYFDNCRPIPIREYMWSDYLPLLNELKVNIINECNIPIN
ncbi:MAG: thermostable hemolysin delta-VPH [Clostridiales bacterium]|nr:thermostable hemolysin delta-VPH [Clostridiales bacterium]